MATTKALRKLTRLVKDNDARNEADAIELGQQIDRLEATIGQYQSPAESAGALFAGIWRGTITRKTVMGQLAEIHAVVANFPALASDLKRHVQDAAHRLDTLKPEMQGINAGMAKLRNEQSSQASRLAQVEDWLRFGYKENTQALKAINDLLQAALNDPEEDAPSVTLTVELDEAGLTHLTLINDRLRELRQEVHSLNSADLPGHQQAWSRIATILERLDSLADKQAEWHADAVKAHKELFNDVQALRGQLSAVGSHVTELSTQLSEVAIEVSSLKTMLTH